MEERSNNSFENEKDSGKCLKKVKVFAKKIKKPYVKRDNSKKNRTKNMNRARKAKAIRQGR